MLCKLHRIWGYHHVETKEVQSVKTNTPFFVCETHGGLKMFEVQTQPKKVDLSWTTTLLEKLKAYQMNCIQNQIIGVVAFMGV